MKYYNQKALIYGWQLGDGVCVSANCGRGEVLLIDRHTGRGQERCCTWGGGGRDVVGGGV